MKVKEHRNGDVSYWFEDKCYAIRFACDDKICYFVRYEDGCMNARAMTSGAFKNCYYSKRTSVVWYVQGYCKAEEFDTEKQQELVKYVKGG